MRHRGNIILRRLANPKFLILHKPIKPLKIDRRSMAIDILSKNIDEWRKLNYTERWDIWEKYDLKQIHENTIWIETKKFTIVSTNDNESEIYFKRTFLNDDGTLNIFSIDYQKEEEIRIKEPLAKYLHTWRKKSFDERLTIWKNNDFLKLYEHSIAIEGHTENIFTIFPTNDEEIVKYFEFIKTEFIPPRLNEKIEQFQLSLDNIVSSLHQRKIENEILEIEKFSPTKNDGLNNYLKNGFKLWIDGNLTPKYIKLKTSYFNYYFFNGMVLGKYYEYLKELQKELKEGKPTIEPELEDDQEKNWTLKERYFMLKKLGLESFERSNDYYQNNKWDIISIVLDCNVSTAKSLINSYDKYKINEDEINRVETYLFNKKKKEK